MSDQGKQIVSRYHEMRAERSPHEAQWRDILMYVRLCAKDVTGVSRSKSPNVYDGTAPEALTELASGLQSYLTNPADRWFALGVEGEELDDDESLAWLDLVSEVMFREFSSPRTSFTTSIHESYLDIGAFGMACLFSGVSDGHLLYKAYSVVDCFFGENKDGIIDECVRVMTFNKRQLIEKFGEAVPRRVREANDMEPHEVLHAVFPRSQRDVMKLGPMNMPWGSYWVLVRADGGPLILRESGFTSFPYHVPRWLKVSSEVYGYGPADNCIPDIKMLNAMEKILIRAGAKTVDPPLQVPDDGFLLPVRTHAGALIFKNPMAPPIEPLETGKNLPFGLEQADQKRQFIRRCFFTDWLKLEKEKLEMTAYETAERRDEKLRMLSPMLGRVQMEMLNPLVSRTYGLLSDMGKIPPAPRPLRGRKLKVEYISPSAKAQVGVKANEMGRFVQEMLPMAQVDPTIMDVVNFDKYAKALALMRSVPRVILRSAAEVAQMRAARAEREQAATIAQLAEPATKAIKNLADARQTGMAIGQGA